MALARALVNRPKVLLLDEPLGALDLKLPPEMQIELKQIQRDVGITFVFVTHDQEEALTLSDRIAVFNDGPGRAGRDPRRALRAARHLVRRRLRRHVEPARERRSQRGARPPGQRQHPAGEDPPPSRRRHAAAGPELVTVDGTVADVVYLGSATHSVVDLDLAGAPRPRGSASCSRTWTSSLDHALARRGQRVRLSWEREPI